MRLLERDAVLGALAEYAADARNGDGRIVLIAGEAGVGKTTLVEALREQEPAARWLWGACEGSFTPRPLGPVYDVASQVGGKLADACATDAQRHRIFQALLDDLLASSQPTILCLEDLHWADEATLDLLGFLAKRLRQAPVLLIVTYRSDGLASDHPLRIVVGELGTNASTRRIDLPPLSRAAVAALAREHGIAADALISLTAGNPFLVAEVLEAGTEVPPSAREAVLARVARLSPDARAALEVAAVIGARVEVEFWREAGDVSAAAIDGCLTTGALLPDGDGFRFRHEIGRRAVEEALPPHRRTELHRRVLDVLVRHGSEDAARLAHHAQAAGDAAAVLEFAPVAARQAANLGAHIEAASQYRCALTFATDKRERAGLLSALGVEYSLIDDWHDAAETQAEALSLWQEIGDPIQAADQLWRMARTMWRLCRGDEAAERARAAVDMLESLPVTVTHGWAYATLAVFGASGDASADLLAQAEAIADEFGDMSLLAHVLDTKGCTRDGVEGAPELKRAIEVAVLAGDDGEAGRGLANLQATFAGAHQLAEAEQVFLDGMEYCADHNIGTYEHCLRGCHGEVLMRLGRWDEAEDMLTFDLVERELSPVNKIGKLLVLGTLDARRGRGTPMAALDEALTYAEAGFDEAYVLEAAIARLEAAWLAGDAEGIRREAERAVPVATSHDPWYAGAIAAWFRRCGLADLEVGDVAPPYAALLAGDWRAAADQWQQLGCPYDEGLALLDSGDPAAMTQAVRIFQRLGASATAARAQALMRQRGITSVPRGAHAVTRANQFGLTRREQEVLALIRDGLTNGEIGARLFIAEKTVDNHVSSVLAKMNVSSRREAARLAAELDQPEPVG